MKPKLSVRQLYMPGHFGNSYEVMGEFEMEDKLKEVKYWGFNGYLDWFDTAGLIAPFNEEPHCHYSSIIWKRKKTFFKIAQRLKMNIGLVITPNHIFANQITKDISAKKENRVFGQLVCPSKPKGEKIILDTYKWLFEDLAKDKIQLKEIQLCPYDYGGCLCKKCEPWIITFTKLSLKIYEIAKKYNKNVELHFIGWWWKFEEHELFNKWINKNVQGLVKSISLHIPYNTTKPIDVKLPEGCKRRSFIHLGYNDIGDIEGIRDIYGLMGPVIAPIRLKKTTEELISTKSEGFIAYSEGVYEDVNHALLGGLSSGKSDSVEEILVEYALRYFEVNYKDAKRWVNFLIPFGNWSEIDIKKSKKEFESLAKVSKQSWRVEQWRYKIKLIELHRKISKSKSWTTKKFNLVKNWRYELENLRRKVYGLGVLRHVFVEEFCNAKWYKEWLTLKNQKIIKYSKEA